MSSLFGLAEQALSAATAQAQSQPGQTASVTGGAQYNSPYHSQQPQGGFNAQEVLAHADGDEEHRGLVANAIQHVQDNQHQHQQQVSQGDLAKYAPVIFQAISSFSKSGGGNGGSNAGGGIGSLVSGALGDGGGNKLMGLVLNHAGNAFSGGSSDDKQNLMNGAAMTLTKLVSQNQLSSFIGGSNSGGLGVLQNIGESFLKNRSG